MYYLILKNCRIFDGEDYLPRLCDIGIKDGIIDKISEEISGDAANILDMEGLLVTPGLIDGHAHIAPLSDLGVPAGTAFLSQGITSALDAGSAGTANFEALRPYMANAGIDVKYLINVASTGVSGLREHPESVDPRHFAPQKIKRLAEKYPDEILGLKIRMGRETALDMGVEPLAKTCELASSLSLFTMVHTTNANVSAGALADCLGDGDVYTHVYQGRANTIFGDGEKYIEEEHNEILPSIIKARERGVLFDLGDACVHCALSVAKKAIEKGFLPDFISSDLTEAAMFRTTAFSLIYVISKMVSLGMSERDVFRRATSSPADKYGFSGGRIKEGAVADIAAFHRRNINYPVIDSVGGKITAGTLYVPQLTVKNGIVVYRDISSVNRTIKV